MILPRTHARRATVQALYQAIINDTSLAKEHLAFIIAKNSSKMDGRYFLSLVEGITKDIDSLDNVLQSAADRELSSVDPVESAILRLAVYELIHHPEISYRVILNEAVELAKSFGGEQSYKYINGVLDKIGAKLRTSEYKAVNGNARQPPQL